MNKFVGIEQIRGFVLKKIRTNYNKLQWETTFVPYSRRFKKYKFVGFVQGFWRSLKINSRANAKLRGFMKMLSFVGLWNSRANEQRAD